MSSGEADDLLQKANARRARAEQVRYLASRIGGDDVIRSLLDHALSLEGQAAAFETEARALTQALDAEIRQAAALSEGIEETRRQLDKLREQLPDEPADPELGPEPAPT